MPGLNQFNLKGSSTEMKSVHLILEKFASSAECQWVDKKAVGPAPAEGVRTCRQFQDTYGICRNAAYVGAFEAGTCTELPRPVTHRLPKMVLAARGATPPSFPVLSSHPSGQNVLLLLYSQRSKNAPQPRHKDAHPLPGSANAWRLGARTYAQCSELPLSGSISIPQLPGGIKSVEKPLIL